MKYEVRLDKMTLKKSEIHSFGFLFARLRVLALDLNNVGVAKTVYTFSCLIWGNFWLGLTY